MPLTDERFIEAWREGGGSPQRVAEITGIAVRNIYKRRKRLERNGVRLSTIPASGIMNQGGQAWKTYAPAYPRQKNLSLQDGVIVVGSDAHIWPGPYTPAMNGFLEVIRAAKPVAVVANGDWLDGARVSRHARIGWAQTPTLKEEIEATQEFAHEVEKAAAPKKTKCGLFWNMGNHDLRYDNMLSARAEDMEGMAGSRLSDHFSRWEFQWSLMVNDNLMIKHRFANGGVHAGYNATLKSGVSTVSGHTHFLEAKPWGDYRGRRYGVQTGCLADNHGPQMEYHENNPTATCPGFAVLTIKDGMLLHPELAEVIGGKCYFRGEVIA